LHAHCVPLFAQTYQKAEFKALFGIIIPHSLPEASGHGFGNASLPLKWDF
jgi:hypothetical protein